MTHKIRVRWEGGFVVKAPTKDTPKEAKRRIDTRIIFCFLGVHCCLYILSTVQLSSTDSCQILKLVGYCHHGNDDQGCLCVCGVVGPPRYGDVRHSRGNQPWSGFPFSSIKMASCHGCFVDNRFSNVLVVLVGHGHESLRLGDLTRWLLAEPTWFQKTNETKVFRQVVNGG